MEYQLPEIELKICDNCHCTSQNLVEHIKAPGVMLCMSYYAYVENHSKNVNFAAFPKVHNSLCDCGMHDYARNNQK